MLTAAIHAQVNGREYHYTSEIFHTKHLIVSRTIVPHSTTMSVVLSEYEVQIMGDPMNYMYMHTYMLCMESYQTLKYIK